jgi:hypothetical protein
MFFFAFAAAALLFSCALPGGAEEGAGGDPGAWWEEETEPPDPAKYGINLNAINKAESPPDWEGVSYGENPLLGWEWQPGANGGYTYFFKRDGTVSSTHHCELVFDNQFSYVLYRNFLVTYGKEMSGNDRLEAWTLHSAGENGELVLFKRDIAAGKIKTYDIYERGALDAHPDKGATSGAPAAPLYTPLLGTWTEDGGGAVWNFTGNGVYTVTPSGGGESEYGYLVRGKKIVTVTRGELKTEGVAAEWKTFPAASERTFTISGGTITLDGLITLTKSE